MASSWLRRLFRAVLPPGLMTRGFALGLYYPRERVSLALWRRQAQRERKALDKFQLSMSQRTEAPLHSTGMRCGPLAPRYDGKMVRVHDTGIASETSLP